MVKHGKIREKTGRTHLMAFISKDDGQSWVGGLMLDERGVSYPDGTQGIDGTIYVTYDRNRGRGEIYMAAFTEEDIEAGACVSDKARLKVLVNKVK